MMWVIAAGAMAAAFERALLGWGWASPGGGVWLFMGLTLTLSLFQARYSRDIAEI